MSIKISIIIPVYDVEKYLRKCLNSCINQTFNDIEIIVVNDCSPDNSDKIMKEYEEKYPDIVKCIYLKENVRQGGARNRGLDIAKGEYILFVDGDDYIDKYMCEKLYKSAISNDADIIVCDYYRVSNNVNFYKFPFLCQIDSGLDISKREIITHKIDPGPTNKLCKRKLLKNYYFPEGTFYEDLAITMVWVLKANKINYISEPLYYYLIRPDSTMNNFDVHKKTQNINAIINLVKQLRYEGIYQKYNFELSVYIFTEILYLFDRFIQLGEENFDDFEKLHQFIIDNIIEWEFIIKNCNLGELEKNILYNFCSNSKYMRELFFKSQQWLSNLFDLHTVVFWGSGQIGRNMISYCKLFNLAPLYIIDTNEKVKGNYINNVLISTFEEIKNKCDMIIVTIKSEKIFNEIREYVKTIEKNIEVKYYKELFEL